MCIGFTGFRLQFNKPMHSIHEIFVRTRTEAGQSNTVYSNASDVDTNIVEAGTESASNEIDEDVASGSLKANDCWMLLSGLCIGHFKQLGFAIEAVSIAWNLKSVHAEI